MKIKQNENGTFDLTEVSLGKMMAIFNAIDLLDRVGKITAVQADVRDLIGNNPEYLKSYGKS